MPLVSPTADAALLLLLGVTLVAAGQLSRRRYTRLVEYGERTRGTVVAIQGQGDDRLATIRFTTRTQQKITDLVYHSAYTVGDEVPILYDPAVPSHYAIGEGSPLGFYGLTIGGGWLVLYALWRLVF
ncbi:DUF3592 domain-containing protein [Hymenobacter sp. B81]|uniref:DUF3592 domain-containing protein n=1 Tax=Hymenobacter sp. B81 TaxID=3344878 RepID=UPI0037DC6875